MVPSEPLLLQRCPFMTLYLLPGYLFYFQPFNSDPAKLLSHGERANKLCCFLTALLVTPVVVSYSWNGDNTSKRCLLQKYVTEMSSTSARIHLCQVGRTLSGYNLTAEKLLGSRNWITRHWHRLCDTTCTKYPWFQLNKAAHGTEFRKTNGQVVCAGCLSPNQ